ncbi:MAG: zinc ribbon domain-containing protein [bacterium]
MNKAIGVIILPIFEYECAKCRKTFEVVSSGQASERVKCPRCTSRKVKKLFSGFSFVTGRGKSAGAGAASSKSSGACRTCSSKSCSTCG